MIHFFCHRILIVAFGLILLAGCGASPGKMDSEAQAPVHPVSCIAVLPAVPMVDVDEQLTPEQLKSLGQGTKTMNMLLGQELEGLDMVVFVSAEQLSGLALTGGENMADMALLVGSSVNCNAVLETTVRRYTERRGTKWSVEQPAAVAFSLRLIGTDAGNILWSAKFDEEQVPVLDNIYNWSKAKTRGFTWITAEELMREGMREKLSGSPYFKTGKPEKTDDSRDYLDGKV